MAVIFALVCALFYSSDLVFTGYDAYFCIFFFSHLEYYRFFYFFLKQMNKNNHRQWTGDEYNGDFILFERGLYAWCDLIFHNFAFRSEAKETTNESRRKLSHFLQSLTRVHSFLCFRGAYCFFQLLKHIMARKIT